MKYAYTAIITPDESGSLIVEFPDLPGCHTFGNDLSEAIYMAQDVLCLWLYDLEQDNKPIPLPSKPQDIKTVGDAFVSIITVDTETYRRYYENKSVKKTLTIPMWLNERAERVNINFSQTLQKALKNELKITD